MLDHYIRLMLMGYLVQLYARKWAIRAKIFFWQVLIFLVHGYWHVV